MDHCQTYQYCLMNGNSQIIAVNFYSLPNYRKNNRLLDHLVTTMNHLLTKYPDTVFFICGDKNSMNIVPLLSGLSRFQQIVNVPTHNHKTLDIIVTNRGREYTPPVTVCPVKCDMPSAGQPSDHRPVISSPQTQANRDYSMRKCRQINEEAIRRFGDAL